MYRFLIYLILIISSDVIYAQDKIIGKWLTADENSHILIYKEGEDYYGKIIWIKDSIDPHTGNLWKDIYNPDESLKKRSVLGLNILDKFKYNSQKNEYFGGKFYFPRNGKTYRGKMWLVNDKTLKMRGYFLFFYQTDIWTKVE